MVYNSAAKEAIIRLLDTVAKSLYVILTSLRGKFVTTLYSLSKNPRVWTNVKTTCEKRKCMSVFKMQYNVVLRFSVDKFTVRCFIIYFSLTRRLLDEILRCTCLNYTV